VTDERSEPNAAPLTRIVARATAMIRREEGQWTPPPYLTVLLFVVVAVPSLAASIILTPPSQVPDAIVQFERAVEVSQGGLVARVQHGEAGDFLPAGIVGFERVYAPLPFDYAAKVDGSEIDREGRVVWGRTRRFVDIPGAADYPPVAYLPGALAVAIARLVTSRIVVAYYMLEVFNALAFVALVSLALILFRGISAALLAALAILPMTISLAGSPSTDGIIFGLSSLFTAVVYYERRRRAAEDAASGPEPAAPLASVRRLVPKLSRLEWVAVASLAVVALAKPPYIVLVLLLGLAVTQPRGVRAYVQRVAPLALLVAVIVLAWYTLGARFQGAEAAVGPTVAPMRQLRFLLAHPTHIVHVAATTLQVTSGFYARSFIGILGWLDTPLEHWLYVGVVLGLGVLVVMRVLTGVVEWRVLACCAVAAGLSAALIFGTLYADWTPVGLPEVLGVQGRYFLPLAPALIVGLGRDRPNLRMKVRWWTLSTFVWLALAGLAAVGSSIALLGRYWLT